MAITLAQMQTSVLGLLHEASNSPLGNIETGTGNPTPTQTTLVTITALLNEGFADMAKNGWSIGDTGSVSLLTGSAGTSYDQITTDSTGTMWMARSAYYTGITGFGDLKPVSRTSFEIWNPNFANAANGVPIVWLENGEEGIQIYPPTQANITLYAVGYVIPITLANSGDTFGNIPDYLIKLGVWYAASQLALINDEDMSLKQRGATWAAAYIQGIQELQNGFRIRDPQLSNSLWGPPKTPQPMQQQGQ